MVNLCTCSARRWLVVSLGLLASCMAWADNPRVRIETDFGTLEAELFPQRAPRTVANFLRYVADGSYDGTAFHRVIDGFMVQGGGYTPDGQRIRARSPIPNESAQTPSNTRGTLAMARTPDPDSATSQFFINQVDNGFLDASPGRPGYTVFGALLTGHEVLDRIAAVPTHANDQPLQPVVIRRIETIEAEPAASGT